MKLITLALLQKDPRVAGALSGHLCHHCHRVHVVPSLRELRDLLVDIPPDVVVLDMEAATLDEVQGLHREFTNLPIVCTHRIADEEMWKDALDAGAVDICNATDWRGIIAATLRYGARSQSAAA